MIKYFKYNEKILKKAKILGLEIEIVCVEEENTNLMKISGDEEILDLLQ